MKIKIDKINLEEFVRLQEYMGRESNIYRTKGSRYAASETGLKVSIAGIDDAHTGINDTGTKVIPIQIYEGVNIEIVDGSLSRSELEELISLISLGYKAKKDS